MTDSAEDLTGPAQTAQMHFRAGLSYLRAGDSKRALEALDQALALEPDLADAVAARAELLDVRGDVDGAREEYERARRLLTAVRPGPPDRRYVLRRRGRFAFEIESYERVRGSVKKAVLPHLAQGNALLLAGRFADALESYDRALKLKPDLLDAVALRAEALAALGRYDEALQAFDKVIAAQPADAETHNSRAIVRMALGKIEEANADWRRQLQLLPPLQSAARACVALRLADYAEALPHLELAVAREPADPYWRLYQLMARRRLGMTLNLADAPGNGAWPTPLIELYANRLAAKDAFERADTAGRRAEALFQIGMMELGRDRQAARRNLEQVVEIGPPDLIEYAAARNELSRLGS